MSSPRTPDSVGLQLDVEVTGALAREMRYGACGADAIGAVTADAGGVRHALAVDDVSGIGVGRRRKSSPPDFAFADCATVPETGTEEGRAGDEHECPNENACADRHED